MLEAGAAALAAAPARSAWRAVRRAVEGRWRTLSRITGEALARAAAPLEAAAAADGPGSAPGSWALAAFEGRRGKASVWVAGRYPLLPPSSRMREGITG